MVSVNQTVAPKYKIKNRLNSFNSQMSNSPYKNLGALETDTLKCPCYFNDIKYSFWPNS